MPKKFVSFSGPTVFSFVDPDTQFPYYAQSMPELVKRIVAYREQNSLPAIIHLETVIENYLCGLPENACSCEELPLRRGWYQYLRGGVALFENLFYGKRNMVDDHTANQRAEICLKCPQNVFPDKDGFLKWSDELAELSTGGRKAVEHDRLGSCACCSCLLRAKVFYKGPFKLTEAEKSVMPAFCWQLQSKEK